MDGIDIPDDQIVPMETIAPGLTGLRITFVNVFGVTNPDGSWILIDAGIPGSAPLIRSWADKHFGKPPSALVLTHGHFDHVGAAKTLAADWNIPVYAQPLEFPYLTGQQAYPPPNPGAGGGMMSLLSPLYPKDPIDISERLHALPSNVSGELAHMPEMPAWQVIHTPGHTPGHVSFFRAQDRTLIVGDAFCSTKPESFFEAALAQQPELHGPPAYFTSDWAAAQRSVQRLAQLEPTTVALGHGKPLSGQAVSGELRQLAARFVETAVPDNRRTNIGKQAAS